MAPHADRAGLDTLAIQGRLARIIHHRQIGALNQAMEQAIGEVVLPILREKEHLTHQVRAPARPARRSTTAPSSQRVSRYFGSSHSSAQQVSCTVPKGNACR